MRTLALVAIVAAALAGPASAVFPDRPPRIVSGYAAGGASDLISRFIADAVSPILGQRVVVENRPGVNGVIGAEVVARSAPDGYSVLPVSDEHARHHAPTDRRKRAARSGTELMPLSNMTLSSYGLVVAAGSPYRNMADILAAARARPGQLTFSSPGPGSAQHLSGSC